MKKAIAISMLCFILSCSLVSCGNNDKNNTTTQNPDSKPAVTKSETTAGTTYTVSGSAAETSESEKHFTDKGYGNVSEHGVMPDETSPLEKIPEAAETAVKDAGDLVSDVIDDLT